ncbi:MAG: STAS domain-containing protein [Rhodospirillales bacterium]|nr:STAS domain-containing protein [Rhodospirillales bacterium]
MTRSDFTPKIITILKAGYSRSDMRADALAGLTVAIVALPLAMALAIASGASPDKGLVTAIIAGFLVSLLGGSRVQIGGPTGAFVVVVFNVIAQHGYDGLVLATLIAGFILAIAGYLRLGQVIKFIPHPVVTGFTAGIAVIIASSQVKDFLGLQIEHVPADFISKWMLYLSHMNTLQGASLFLGLVSLVTIILLNRFKPKWPRYLIAVAAAAVLAVMFDLPVETIGSRFPDIPAGLPMPSLPSWTFAQVQEVLPSAFTIAFLAGIEALLSAMVADGMTGFRHRSNQELAGQGFANIASALFGGLPATGAIARTATNIKAGGRTPFAGMFHALFLLLFMLFATDVMAYVPMTALAAVLFMVSWGMSEIKHFVHIFKISPMDRLVLLLTFFLTVLVDLTVAIGVGVTLASLLFMSQMSKSVELSFNSESEEGEEEDQRVSLPSGVEVFHIAGPVFFGVAGDLLDTLKRMGQMPKVLIVRMRFVPLLDATGAAAIVNLVQECHKKETIVIFSAMQKQPRDMLARAKLSANDRNVFFSKDYGAALTLAKGLVGDGESF